MHIGESFRNGPDNLLSLFLGFSGEAGSGLIGIEEGLRFLLLARLVVGIWTLDPGEFNPGGSLVSVCVLTNTDVRRGFAVLAPLVFFGSILFALFAMGFLAFLFGFPSCIFIKVFS
jgi:hypothetical protein